MKRLISIALILFLESPTWAAYTYYRTVTVAHGQVPSNQSSFPILVCANGSSPCNASVSGLNQSGGGAHVTNSNGYDIGFFTTSACTTQVTGWEVENYVPSTGEIEAWVNQGTVSSSADTTFYLCYGNGSISTFQSTVANVWDSNYVAVYHLPNGTSLTANDSTGNANNANTVTATAVAGMIDGAGNFNSSAYVQINNTSSLSFSGAGTLEAWVYPGSGAPVGYRLDLITRHNSGGYEDYGLGLFDDYYGSGLSYVVMSGSGAGIQIAVPWNQNLNSWQQVVGAMTTSGTSPIYYNGTSAGTGTTYGFDNYGGAGNTFLGYNNDYSQNPFVGYLDEVRISNSTRSADYIKTEYNSESSPSTFITFGSEQGGGGGPTPSGGTLPLMGI